MSVSQYALAGFAEYERGAGEGDALYAKSAAQGNSWAQCRLGSLAEENILSGEVRGGKTASEVSLLVGHHPPGVQRTRKGAKRERREPPLGWRTNLSIAVLGLQAFTCDARRCALPWTRRVVVHLNLITWVLLVLFRQLWLVAALKGNALAQLALGEAHAVGESGAALDQGRARVLLEVTAPS